MDLKYGIMELVNLKNNIKYNEKIDSLDSNNFMCACSMVGQDQP